MYNLTTIAIVPADKSELLSNILISNGINVKIENQYINQSLFSHNYLVKVNKKDLNKVIELIEKHPDYQITFGIDKDILSLKNMIFVPVDFSDYSKKACEFAFNYAAVIGSPIKLFHAYFSPLYSISFPDNDTFNGDIRDEEIQHEMYDIVKKQFDDFVEYLKLKISRKEIPNIKFTTEILEGIPEEEIERWTTINKPMLVVMGTRGKSQKEADMLGSVTAEVIDTSRVPIFAIPDKTNVNNISKIKKIAFVTNFDQRDLICFYKLMDMQEFNKKSISFICIDSSKEISFDKNLQDFKKYIESHFKYQTFEYIKISEEDLLKNTDEAISKYNIDLLVLTTHKRNVFARLFNPSIAHKVVFHTDTPLLVIRN